MINDDNHNDIGHYIDISNLDEHMIYEIIHEQQKIIVNWDYDNDYINSLMTKEFNEMFLTCEYYFNGSWVNELKRAFNWKMGNNIGISTHHYVFVGKIVISQFQNVSDDMFNLKIDENGFLCVKPFRDNIRMHTFVRCNCMYNYLLDEENSPYIFK